MQSAGWLSAPVLAQRELEGSALREAGHIEVGW